MALRIRKNGKILCAAMHKAKPGDTYIDDGLHYTLSVRQKVLVTEEMEGHKKHGEWWWRGNYPKWAKIDPFYFDPFEMETKSKKHNCRVGPTTP